MKAALNRPQYFTTFKKLNLLIQAIQKWQSSTQGLPISPYSYTPQDVVADEGDSFHGELLILLPEFKNVIFRSRFLVRCGRQAL